MPISSSVRPKVRKATAAAVRFRQTLACSIKKESDPQEKRFRERVRLQQNSGILLGDGVTLANIENRWVRRALRRNPTSLFINGLGAVQINQP